MTIFLKPRQNNSIPQTTRGAYYKFKLALTLVTTLTLASGCFIEVEKDKKESEENALSNAALLAAGGFLTANDLQAPTPRPTLTDTDKTQGFQIRVSEDHFHPDVSLDDNEESETDSSEPSFLETCYNTDDMVFAVEGETLVINYSIKDRECDPENPGSFRVNLRLFAAINCEKTDLSQYAGKNFTEIGALMEWF